ncbi:hypothetical protein HanPSC8_Chr02g0083361 [Helianthus annuus]|nr:hypothetical protein HanPSC8_Chr02g0083361 [Helianthus annuus]
MITIQGFTDLGFVCSILFLAKNAKPAQITADAAGQHFKKVAFDDGREEDVVEVV